MAEILVTGGAGFFGGILKRRLLSEGYQCVSIDLQSDDDRHPSLTSIQGDIRDHAAIEQLFARHQIASVFHCAAILAHAKHAESFLWSSNVEGTRVVADAARQHHVERIVFTSSNCLWGQSFGHPVSEDQPPDPVELYGRSKLEGERVLQEYAASLVVITVRCPTIIDSGRLGLLAILYEFIDENRKVWTVGGGENRYQFIYAQDLAEACIRMLGYQRSDVFNIGSDDVKPMCDIYQYVIDHAGSRSRVSSLPKAPAILAMKLAYHLGVSPLGPYHYKMIAEDFLFDTAHIKQSLGWSPTMTNEQMLLKSYEYYHSNRDAIGARQNVSDHRKPADMGIIRLLKWIS
jgi:nucleoside-diphosphate-sugar epimerase